MDASWGVVDAIVVGVDGSPDSHRAVEWALQLAERDQRPVTLLHASEGAPLARHLHPQPDALDDAEAAAHRQAPEVTVGVLRATEGPRHVLIEASEKAAVIVLGARGSGPLGRLRLGSVAQAVSRHASCPVVITRAAGAGRPPSLLVGVDGEPGCERVLDFAFRVAEARDWPVTVLHTFWDETSTTGDLSLAEATAHPAPANVADAVAGAAARHPRVRHSTLLSRGFADRRLLAATVEHSLVVIGHQELPWLDALVYGHVTPVVVEHAVGDVAVVPTAPPAEPWQ